MQTLLPFAGALPISLSADFALTRDGVRIRFHLEGPQHNVVGGLADGAWDAATIVRADGLWRRTCFEAFWSEPSCEAYWELNLSPAGAWNLYRFTSCRMPQPPRRSDDYALVSLRTTATDLVCDLATALRPRALDLSLCAVIQLAGKAHHFAQVHGGRLPDFHRRDSFTIRRDAR